MEIYMELAKKITGAAMGLLKDGTKLPVEIPGAPKFFLATHEDKTVQAFGTVEFAGVFYKIGSLKN
jgi:hypothetical protein